MAPSLLVGHDHRTPEPHPAPPTHPPTGHWTAPGRPERPSRILGYYSVSAASLDFERLTEADGKGLPAYPVPAVRIGRLATSLSVRGLRLGELLLQNAIKRGLQARNTLGVHAVLVEAKNPEAERFYRKYGFRLCDPTSRQLYMPLGAE